MIRKDLGLLTQEIDKEWLGDTENPVLISYPRSGRYWLIFMMEAYFKRLCNYFPSPYVEDNSRMILPWHDLDLISKPKNLIYLYREDVISVIFSWLSLGAFLEKGAPDFHATNKDVEERTLQYARHLERYLFEDNFSEKKLVISYNGLINDGAFYFNKICEFFNVPFDLDRYSNIEREFNRKRVGELNDRIGLGAVITTSEYETKRRNFHKEFGSTIKEIFYSRYSYLALLLDICLEEE